MRSVRAIRSRILTPNMSETSLDVRGFHKKSPEAQQMLETVGKSFLTGYAYATAAKDVEEAEQQLEQIDRPFRGFAYEGAGMGFAILDGLPIGGSHNVERFLASRGQHHAYMVYIGVGWAMARLPRFRWRRVTVADPLMRWLVLDGFGFHQAYFKTEQYVTKQYQEPDFPWPTEGQRWYSNHAIDQGLGRALWFVGGTNGQLVADMLDKFPASRQPDLWSGAGLAATYAGGVTEQELRAFRERAGRYRPQVAQGSAFAATARIEAGLLLDHTAVATGVLCGMTPQEASAVSSRNKPVGEPETDLPAYEVWRRRIAESFAAVERI